MGGEIQLAKAKAQADNIYPFRAAFPITHLAAGTGKQTQADDELTVLLSKRCLRENSWRRVSAQALPYRHYSQVLLVEKKVKKMYKLISDFSGLELSDCSLNQFESRYNSEFTIWPCNMIPKLSKQFEVHFRFLHFEDYDEAFPEMSRFKQLMACDNQVLLPFTSKVANTWPLPQANKYVAAPRAGNLGPHQSLLLLQQALDETSSHTASGKNLLYKCEGPQELQWDHGTGGQRHSSHTSTWATPASQNSCFIFAHLPFP